MVKSLDLSKLRDETAALNPSLAVKSDADPLSKFLQDRAQNAAPTDQKTPNLLSDFLQKRADSTPTKKIEEEKAKAAANSAADAASMNALRLDKQKDKNRVSDFMQNASFDGTPFNDDDDEDENDSDLGLEMPGNHTKTAHLTTSEAQAAPPAGPYLGLYMAGHAAHRLREGLHNLEHSAAHASEEQKKQNAIKSEEHKPRPHADEARKKPKKHVEPASRAPTSRIANRAAMGAGAAAAGGGVLAAAAFEAYLEARKGDLLQGGRMGTHDEAMAAAGKAVVASALPAAEAALWAVTPYSMSWDSYKEGHYLAAAGWGLFDTAAIAASFVSFGAAEAGAATLKVSVAGVRVTQVVMDAEKVQRAARAADIGVNSINKARMIYGGVQLAQYAAEFRDFVNTEQGHAMLALIAEEFTRKGGASKGTFREFVRAEMKAQGLPEQFAEVAISKIQDDQLSPSQRRGQTRTALRETSSAAPIPASVAKKEEPDHPHGIQTIASIL